MNTQALTLAWARWHPQRGRVKVCFAAFGVGALGIVVVALSPWFWLAAAAFWLALCSFSFFRMGTKR